MEKYIYFLHCVGRMSNIICSCIHFRNYNSFIIWWNLLSQFLISSFFDYIFYSGVGYFIIYLVFSCWFILLNTWKKKKKGMDSQQFIWLQREIKKIQSNTKEKGMSNHFQNFWRKTQRSWQKRIPNFKIETKLILTIVAKKYVVHHAPCPVLVVRSKFS